MSASPPPPNSNRGTRQTAGANANTSTTSSAPQVHVSNLQPATLHAPQPTQAQRTAAAQNVRRQLLQSATTANVRSTIAQRLLDRAPVIGTQNLPELVTENRAFFRNAASMQQYVDSLFPIDREGTNMADLNLARQEAVSNPEVRTAQRLALEPILANLGISRVRGTRDFSVPSHFAPGDSTLLSTPDGRHCLTQVIRSLYLLDNVALAQNLSDVLREVQRRYPQALTINNALLLSTAPSDYFWQTVNGISRRTAMPLPPPFHPLRAFDRSIVNRTELPVVAPANHFPRCSTGNSYFDYICGSSCACARRYSQASALNARLDLENNRSHSATLDVDIANIWLLFPANTALARTTTGPDLDALFHTYPLLRTSLVATARAALLAMGYLYDPDTPSQFPPAWWATTGGPTPQELWAVQYIMHSISQIAPAQVALLAIDLSDRLTTRGMPENYRAQVQALLDSISDPHNIPVPDFPNAVRSQLGLPALQVQPSASPLEPEIATLPVQPSEPLNPRTETEHEVNAYVQYVNSPDYSRAITEVDVAIFDSYLPALIATLFPLERPSTAYPDAPTLSPALLAYIQSAANRVEQVTPQMQIINRWLEHCGIYYTTGAVTPERVTTYRFEQTMQAEDDTYRMQFSRILQHLSVTGQRNEARRLLELMLSIYPQDSLPSQTVIESWCATAGTTYEAWRGHVAAYIRYVQGDLYHRLISTEANNADFTAGKNELIGALFPLEMPSHSAPNGPILDQALRNYLSDPANKVEHRITCRSVVERFFMQSGIDVRNNLFLLPRLNSALRSLQSDSWRLNMERIVRHLIMTENTDLAGEFVASIRDVYNAMNRTERRQDDPLLPVLARWEAMIADAQLSTRPPRFRGTAEGPTQPGMATSTAGVGLGTGTGLVTGGRGGPGRTPPPPAPAAATATGPVNRTSFDHIKVENIDVSLFRNGCIVNAANGALQRGDGVCGAIFRRAEDGAAQLTAECNNIISRLPAGSRTQDGHRGLPPGSAELTSAPGETYSTQDVTYIIHAVGPHLKDARYYTELPVDAQGRVTSRDPIPARAQADLRAAYRNTFTLAVQNGIRRVALPVISGGLYLYDTISSFREGIGIASEPAFRGLEITFCFWNPRDQDQARALLNDAGRILQQSKNAERQNQGRGGANAP
ncbi:MAG: macro domain-containing protein [Enterovibrio sp.]